MDKERAEEVHRKFVQAGCFDAIEQTVSYEAGDIVAVRETATVHGVIRVLDDYLLLSDGHREYLACKINVRLCVGYMEAMRVFLGLPDTYVVDRKGHAQTIRFILKSHDD